MVRKIEKREIGEAEFLEIMESFFLRTTYASLEAFGSCIPSLKVVYQERVRVAGKMTVGYAELCAQTFTALDQGI